MNDQKFDRMLMEMAGSLPPGGEKATAEDFTPWHTAMSRILWGMGLMTFRLEALYLQYLLPLLGAFLLYLGFRSLRGGNAWFSRCCTLSLGLLVWYGVSTVLQATRLWYLATRHTPVFWAVAAAVNAASLLLLLCLRHGIRQAFRDSAGAPPRDWLIPGIGAWLLCLALAVWGQLEPLPAGGYPVYYLRGLGAVVLYLLFLILLGRQGRALARRGYALRPAPVKHSGRAVGLLTFSTVFLGLILVLLLGGRQPTPAGTAETPELSPVRQQLIALGMPEELAADLSTEDLRLCENAVAVHESTNKLLDGEPAAPQALGSGTVELRSWTVVLADQSLRFFQTFRWLEEPAMSMQEGIYADPDSGKTFASPTARLTWSQSGQRLAADLPVALAGGQKAEELTEEQQWWYGEELKRLGHLQYQPYALFSLPKGGEDIRGYLAYSREAEAEDYSSGTIFGGWYYLHQSLPQYPYLDMGDCIASGSGVILSFGGNPFPKVGISYGTHIWMD